MFDIARNFHQRHEDKISFVQMRMRNNEIEVSNDIIGEEQNVNINRPFSPFIGARSTHFSLDSQHFSQHILRRQHRREFNGLIQKIRLIGLTKRMRANDRQATTNNNSTPAEIAAGILYLASDDASFATGTVLVVDGGFTA